MLIFANSLIYRVGLLTTILSMNTFVATVAENTINAEKNNKNKTKLAATDKNCCNPVMAISVTAI